MVTPPVRLEISIHCSRGISNLDRNSRTGAHVSLVPHGSLGVCKRSQPCTLQKQERQRTLLKVGSLVPRAIVIAPEPERHVGKRPHDDHVALSIFDGVACCEILERKRAKGRKERTVVVPRLQSHPKSRSLDLGVVDGEGLDASDEKVADLGKERSGSASRTSLQKEQTYIGTPGAIVDEDLRADRVPDPIVELRFEH